ncbi:MAG: CopG family ribbon-helix-helix protein [Proteobacteria bacterium]|nr:CopG family ribbon-helix-helix protein [Pseudomonadota bacterium]
MSQTTTLTIRVDSNIKKRLETIASYTKRSKSFLASQAVEEYILTQEWQVAGINKALKSLDDGNNIAHEDVTKLVKSWQTDIKKPR